MSKDCIKIEELKMFLGTGLKCYITDYEQGLTCTEPLAAIEDNILCDTIWINNQFELIDIRPLLRPFSELSDDDCDWLKNRLGSNILATKLYSGFIDCTKIRYDVVQYLASKHYDIFNWLGRGLADKLND